MIDQILQYDTELFFYLNGLGTPTWDPFWMAYTTKFNWIPFYAILLYLLFRQIGKKPFLITILVVALMVLFTDQITNLFKSGFHRLRPCHVADLLDRGMRVVREGCGGQHGFFSGHASNSMGVAVFTALMLRHRYKFMPYILIIWALLMAYSRVYVGVHYPLDILCGMIFGAISGYAFYRLNIYLMHTLVNFSKGRSNRR